MSFLAKQTIFLSGVRGLNEGPKTQPFLLTRPTSVPSTGEE